MIGADELVDMLTHSSLDNLGEVWSVCAYACVYTYNQIADSPKWLSISQVWAQRVVFAVGQHKTLRELVCQLLQ